MVQTAPGRLGRGQILSAPWKPFPGSRSVGTCAAPCSCCALGLRGQRVRWRRAMARQVSRRAVACGHRRATREGREPAILPCAIAHDGRNHLGEEEKGKEGKTLLMIAQLLIMIAGRNRHLDTWASPIRATTTCSVPIPSLPFRSRRVGSYLASYTRNGQWAAGSGPSWSRRLWSTSWGTTAVHNVLFLPVQKEDKC